MPLPFEEFPEETSVPAEYNEGTVSFEPGDHVEPKQLLVPSGDFDKFDAQYQLEFLQGGSAWEEEKQWLESEKEKREKNHLVPTDNREKIGTNMRALAVALQQLLKQMKGTKAENVVVTSALRTPQHNDSLRNSVFASRHQRGLAVDLHVFGSEGKMPPADVLEIAKSVPEAPRFEHSVLYPSAGFVHLALSSDAPSEFNGETQAYESPEDGPVRSVDGSVGQPDDLDTGEAANKEMTAAEFASKRGDLLSQLGVRQTGTPYEKTETGRKELLDVRGAPKEGEVDIGDLRFGSVKFDAAEDSDRNQPTAIGQQSAGNVASIGMLRTDMNPILAKSSSLPETTITISLNATERDDVNKRLRPLVAMQRRLPFCAARSPDLARMMFGFSASEDVEGRLNEIYPTLNDEQIDELKKNMPEDLGDLWVPITIRQIAADTQPGASGLFQVHVVMRLANIMPYVPRMQFWKDTESATEWARYLSLRSTQGASVRDNPTEEIGVRNVNLPNNTSLLAAPPDKMGEKQTPNPHKSYPFKKMYRGLLEEYLPQSSGGNYDRLKRQGKTDQLEPIGRSRDGEVYEPGYPISDGTRAFERYDSSSPIGLQYTTINQARTPETRLQELLSAYKEQYDLAASMDAAIGVTGLASDEVDGLEEAGKVTPILVGPGRKWGKIMLAVGQTADAFAKVGSEVMAAAKGGPANSLEETMRAYNVDFVTDGMKIREESYDIVPTDVATTESEEVRRQLGLINEDIRTDKLPQRVMSNAGLFKDGGVADFQVPDRKFEDVFIKFSDRFSELQKGILATYVNIIEKMGRAENWPDYDKSEDAIWSGWFDTFISDQIRDFVDEVPGERTKNADVRGIVDRKVKTIRQVQFQNWVPEGFGSFMLTYEFYRRILDYTADWEGNDDVPQPARDARADLKALLDDTQRLSQKAAEIVKGSRGAVKSALKESAESTKGYLALENATVESLRVEFSNRYGDREWKGYPNPVTQHLGGSNAEISIEFTTNNQLLLDQLGELQRSQESLSEQRKSHDVVPPLLQIQNPGNILRAHGITQCAYRSHTKNMAENRPGYYKVRLELVQDEGTLVRTEISRKIGSDNSDRTDSASASAPITLPIYKQRSSQSGSTTPPGLPPGVGDIEGSRSSGSNSRPVGIYDLAARIYDEDIPARQLGETEFAENRSGESGVYGPEAYNSLDDPDFEQILSRRSVESIDVEYHPNREDNIPPEFRGDVRWRDQDGNLHRTKDVSFSQMLTPLLSLLQKTRRELEQDEFRQVVQRVEGALSTGSRKGLVLSWWTLAKARGMEYLTRNKPSLSEVVENSSEYPGYEVDTQLTVLGLEPTVVPTGQQEKDFLNDDVTRIVKALAYGESPPSALDGHQFVGYHARPYLLAATDLMSIFLSNSQLYDVYDSWVKGRDVPAPVDKDLTQRKIETVHKRVLDEREALPSTYTDLLMPPINDPAQGGVNVFGPDFPFGPGTASLNEDLHLDNYELADNVRQMTAIRMATIGFDTAKDYVTGDGDNGKHFSEAFNAALEDIRADANEQTMENSPFSLEEPGGDYFKDLVKYINPDSDSLDTSSLPDEDTLPNIKGFSDLDEQYQNQVFNGDIEGNVRTEDLVQALQISKTIEYVTQVMELAAANAGAQLKPEGEELHGNIGDLVSDLFQQAREGGGLSFSNLDLSDVAGASEHMSRVSGDVWLKKQREELLRIYEADPEVIQRHLGYYDKHTESRRAKLREKLRDTWTDWKGMRRAFPTYQLVMTGRPGTGISKVVGDQYSWEAVQQIEVRNLASNAGQQCDLVISNMRKRLVSNAEDQTVSDIYGRNTYDPHKELDVGTHMQVYMGYGPDATHLKPFLGRVTGVNIGPITQVQVSSYSTTLSNAPSDGRGFFVDGWDGQQSLSEAILYTISQTAGLEGLGRSAPGAVTDRLGRSPRGFAESDYRSSVMAKVYQAFGEPGLEWATGGEQQAQQTGTLLDVVSRHGVGNLKDMMLGDPQIYENIWVTSSPETAGAGDMLFAGLKDLLVGGKGWGWMAVPGESAWTQLKKQSKLFSDYVVTTRNYNEHVPRSQQGEHPPRQTIYFGPKGGGYKSSSRKSGADMHQQLEDEELERMVQKALGETDTSLLEEYRDLFVRRTVLKTLVRLHMSGEAADFQSELGRSLRNIAEGTLGGIAGIDIEDVASGTDVAIRGDIYDRLSRKLNRLFPNTFRRLQKQLQVDRQTTNADNDDAEYHVSLQGLIQEVDNAAPLLGSDLVRLYNLDSESTKGQNWTLSYQLTEQSMEETGLDVDGNTPQEKTQNGILQAFQKDLLNLAKEPMVFTNLTNDSFDENPLINHIQDKLESQGFQKSQRMEPVQKHHFSNLYKHMADQQITAADQHPNFANRVILTFPTEQDNRLAAYVGSEGEKKSYQVQASPTIDEDYIVERQVPYMNLRYNQIDASGQIADMLDRARDDNVQFTDLTEARDDLRTDIDDGEKEITAENYVEGLEGFEGTMDPKDALTRIRKEIQDTLERLQPYYSRPKYSTCATNILRDSFRHMYTGDVIMMGDPTIEPYHIVHLWDDADQMQGPAEVEGVYHRFDGQQGFYSQVKPKLATYVRGADNGMDTQWMQSAMNVSSYMSWAERIGSFAGTSAGLLARGTGYYYVGSILRNSVGAGGGSLARTALGLGRSLAFTGPVFLADLAYNTVSFLYEGGVQEAQRYVGLINGAMDSNPIMFLPLSYRGQPYTAGLTGATGPSSMNEVALSSLDDEGSIVGEDSRAIIDRLTSVFDARQQAPQPQ